MTKQYSTIIFLIFESTYIFNLYEISYILSLPNIHNALLSKSRHWIHLCFTGTSNWSADYFNTTAGVGLVVSQDFSHSHSPGDTLVGQLSAVFERDWDSKFAVPLEKLGHNPDCVFSKA